MASYRGTTTTHQYSAREIIVLIQKELGVPRKAISFTFSPDGTYNISIDNSLVPPQRVELIDPFDSYEQY